MAVVFGAIGAVGAGTTSCNPAYPTGINASTSILIASVGGRSSVSNTAFTAPAGWTSLGELEAGVGTFGNGTGTRRIGYFIKDTVTGSETGTVAFTFAAGNATSTISATIFRLDKTAGFTISTQFAGGADVSNDTSYSAITFSTRDWQTNDLLCAAVCQNIDTGTQSATSVTAPGVTFGTRVSLVNAAFTNGNRHRRFLDAIPVNSASTTAAVTYAYTISAAGSGPAAFLIVRETATDVSVALIGNSITTGAGQVVPPRGHGQAFATGQGSIASVAFARALSGAVFTSGQGLATANADGTVPLLGSSSTASAGTVAVASGVSQALTGQALAGSKGPGGALSLLFLGGVPSYQGTPVVNVRPTNIGIAAPLTLSTGILTAAGNSPITVNLSGVEATSVPGTVDGGQRTIGGVAATGAVGAFAKTAAVAMTGAQVAFAGGTIAPDQGAVDTLITSDSGAAISSASVSLVGAEATGAQGDVDINADANLPLVGEASTAAAGTLVPEVAPALVGVGADGAQSQLGAPGGVELIGAEFTAFAGDVFLTADRTFAISGESATVQDGSTFASSLAFPPGQEITVSQQDMGPREVTLVGEELHFIHGVMLALPPVVPPFVGDAPGNSGGWVPLRRRKTREEVHAERVELGIAKPKPPDPDPVKVAVTAIKALPAKPKRRTIRLEDLIGKKSAAKADTQDLEAIERAVQRENEKRRKDEEADEITLLLD